MHFPSLPGLLVAWIAGLLSLALGSCSEMGASLGQGIREIKKSPREWRRGGHRVARTRTERAKPPSVHRSKHTVAGGAETACTTNLIRCERVTS